MRVGALASILRIYDNIRIMWTSMEITSAEAVLANAKISIAAMCRRVQIHPASWQNWKNGRAVPSMRKWESVQRELRKIKQRGRK
jgi:hypothetical protein